MAQISRFDPWKDPQGVIEAYKMVKEEIPDVQLSSPDRSRTTIPRVCRSTTSSSRRAETTQDLLILSNFQQVGNTAINCFQRAADVVIQKSIREGFGLTVAEAAWKGKPVLGGRAGGITLQIEDGATGYLVESVEETARAVARAAAGPGAAAEMGEAARELIRERFLTTRETRATGSSSSQISA